MTSAHIRQSLVVDWAPADDEGDKINTVELSL
jgi:hypothetical protein